MVAGDQAIINQVMNAPEDSWKVGVDVPVDAEPAWWPDFFPNFRLENLREVILHVLTETSVHAWHLDATRELIDGRTWLVLS